MVSDFLTQSGLERFFFWTLFCPSQRSRWPATAFISAKWPSCKCRLRARQAEKSLRDLGEKVSASDRGKIEAQMNTLKETMPGEDAGRIRAQIAELQQAMMVLGQAMYSGSAATGPGRPDGNGHGEPQGEDVVEGEYQKM